MATITARHSNVVYQAPLPDSNDGNNETVISPLDARLPKRLDEFGANVTKDEFYLAEWLGDKIVDFINKTRRERQ